MNRVRYEALFAALLLGRQYEAANAALHEALVLDPNFHIEGAWEPDYLLGNYQRARARCEAELQYAEAHLCLAIVYEKLGHHHDAEAQLAKYKDLSPEDWVQFSGVYAQWGDVARALSCLDEAVRIRHVGLQYLKVEPLWDPLRNEPRFQAIERALKFPD